MNSLGTALELWEPQVVPLWPGGHRLVRYDQRGHGGTPAPHGPYTIEELAGDALELLDRLGLERVSVCGLSIGGAVATWIAANAADRVDRLVVASRRRAVRDAETCGTSGRRPCAPAGRRPSSTASSSRWFTPAFAAAQPRRSSPGSGRPSAPSNREGYAGCCDALAAWDATRAPAPGVRADARHLGGRRHGRAAGPAASELADGIPDARLVVLEDCAHLASANQPAAFADAVLLHLAGEAP